MWHKMHNIGFWWYIRGWGVSKQIVCLILTMFIVKLYLKAIEVSSKLKEAEGVV